MGEGPQGMARQARIRGPLRAARLRGISREREVARAQARKARQGHRGARCRGGHGPCGLGPEVRQGDTGRDRLLHRSRASNQTRHEGTGLPEDDIENGPILGAESGDGTMMPLDRKIYISDWHRSQIK